MPRQKKPSKPRLSGGEIELLKENYARSQANNEYLREQIETEREGYHRARVANRSWYSNINPLPCLVCGCVLAHAAGPLGGEVDERGFALNQPSGGTAFSTGGHYGSTVFDPMGSGERLDIAVCDPCLKERWERTREYTRRERTTYIYRTTRDTGNAYPTTWQEERRQRAAAAGIYLPVDTDVVEEDA